MNDTLPDECLEESPTDPAKKCMRMRGHQGYHIFHTPQRWAEVIHETHTLKRIPGESNRMCSRCYKCECHEGEDLELKCEPVGAP